MSDPAFPPYFLKPEAYGALGAGPVHSLRGVWRDAERQRQLAWHLYLPPGQGRVPLVIFSHGLGGSRETGAAWLSHWSAHGFACLALQHPGSDRDQLAGVAPLDLPRVMAQAMTGEQMLSRVADVQFVVARLARGASSDRAEEADMAEGPSSPAGAAPLPPAEAASPSGDAPEPFPFERLDLDRLGFAGHSFGALTAQALAGERLDWGKPDVTTAKPFRAYLALSPSARGAPAGRAAGFAAICRPFFSITGSRDKGIGRGDVGPENRRLPFAHMPPGHKYLLVLAGATHRHFAGEAEDRRRTPAFTRAVQAASLAFWRCYLMGEEAARRWLQSGFPATLGEGDAWAWK